MFRYRCWWLLPQCHYFAPRGNLIELKGLFIGQLYLYYGIIIGEGTVAVIHFLIYLAVIVLQLVLIPAAPTELEDY